MSIQTYEYTNLQRKKYFVIVYKKILSHMSKNNICNGFIKYSENV